MKKIIMIIMALCMIAPMAQAELTKKQTKKIEKQAKQRAKELKAQGFEVMGSVPMQAAIEKHLALVEEGAVPQETMYTSKSKNNARQACLSNAMNEYASKQLSQIKGRSVVELQSEEVDPNSEEFSKFFSTFERVSQGEIRGELQESYAVCRSLPDGRYEVYMYLTVDPEKASKSRVRAMRNAIIESGVPDIYEKAMTKAVETIFSE